MLYFFVGSRDLDAGDVHGVAQSQALHGVKVVGAAPGPVGRLLHRRFSLPSIPCPRGPCGGSVRMFSIYDDFHEAALNVIDRSAIKPLKVVVDGGQGLAGPMVGAA